MEHCISCLTELVEDSQYCHMCGRIVKAYDPKTLLGIDISDEDILNYITSGRMVKTVKVGKAITAVIQTMTTGEFKTMHELTDSVSAPVASEKTHQIGLEIRELSFCLKSINGTEMPADKTKRVKMIEGLGTAIHQILLQKVRLLHEVVGFLLQEGQVENF